MARDATAIRTGTDKSGVPFQITKTQLEPNSWITLELRADSLHNTILDLVFIGVLSYSLRQGLPSIQSVLLAFSHGKRLKMSRDSILISNFIQNGNGGEWEQFNWDIDGYDEWECDELPPTP